LSSQRNTIRPVCSVNAQNVYKMYKKYLQKVLTTTLKTAIM
jgi:hypothetical protein